MKVVCGHKKFKAKGKMHYSVVDLPEKRQQLFFRFQLLCTECGEPFIFKAPIGYSTEEPTTDLELKELFCPIDYPVIFEETEEIIDLTN